MYIMNRSYAKFFVYCTLFTQIILESIFVEKLLYTTIKIADPRVISLINSQAFQRLYKIQQYGIDPKVLQDRAHTAVYNRAIHSLGVYWLLHRYNAPFEEQITGLFHDGSHTPFSHVAERVFKHKDDKSSYQDDHHLELLADTDLEPVLKKMGFSLEDIDHKNPAYTRLEKDLPDACADRIEYNLSGGVLEKLITPEEAMAILDHLRFENDRWFFIDAGHARKFAEIPLYHTEHIWGAQMSAYVSEELAQAIRKALELGILSMEEVLHGTDEAVWQKLLACNSAEIQTHIQNMLSASSHADEINAQPRNNKFRGIDPWVQQGGEFKRLTELDESFRKEFERVKADSYSCSGSKISNS